MKLHKLILTENACYKAGKKITPKGIMVHSTGANNPNLCRYVGPDDGLLGENKYGNHWNNYYPGGQQICVHAFIGKLKDGSVATYQTLPWDHRGWHGGGDANNTHIGFEICEDGLTDAAYFDKVYQEAVELCVYLCKEYNLTEKDIIDHSEGHDLGIASNHGDVKHWFPKHGKSMDTFRADVKNLLTQKEPETQAVIYRVQVGAFTKKTNAEKKRMALVSAGFEDAFLACVDGNLWRVQVGAYSVKANAEKKLAEVQKKGFTGFVTTLGGTVAAAPIQEGSTVRVKKGATDYNGGRLADFVYERDHKVKELNGNRAVITYNGVIVAAVHTKDLTLA